MTNTTMHELQESDEKEFIQAMAASKELHNTWVQPPLNHEEFAIFLQKNKNSLVKTYLVKNNKHELVGVFNLSEIIRGCFQSCFLGYYAIQKHAGKGLMSQGLKLVIRQVFEKLNLHRIQAGVQPTNKRSIELLKANHFQYEGYSPRYLKINDSWQGHEIWTMTFEDYIKDRTDIIKQDSIEIEPYHPNWPALATKEISILKTTLPDFSYINIQHIGSTAIPNMPAKPIIDILIGVANLEITKLWIIPYLQKLNYEYWDKNPDQTRMFFAKGMPPFGTKRTHHVHIVEHTSEHWNNKIKFKNILLNHPELAKEYSDLKKLLADKYKFDREKYTSAKKEFIQKALTQHS